MSDTLWLRLYRGSRRLRQRPDWADLLGADWPERIMALDGNGSVPRQAGRSTGRLVLSAGDRRLGVYLKRHYRLPRWLGLLAALWPERGWSPALQEVRHLEWARTHGLPVPAVVAAGEYLGPWGRLQSFLAVEELAGMLPLHEAVPAAARSLGCRRLPPLEGDPDRGNGPAGARPARPPLLPQGLVPVPLLRPGGGHRNVSRIGTVGST